MKKYRLLFLLLLLGYNTGLTQQYYTVSGTIKDGESGETLIGASVAAARLGLGTITNEYGFFSISLPGEDSIQVKFSYVGFQSEEKVLWLSADLSLDIELGTGIRLDEVIVKANSFEEQLNSTEMSVETVTTKEAKIIPVLLGESDILKAIQLKPGIPSGSEGTTGLFVRGGNADQNLIVLDEAIVYNANHLFGFFSTFNTDAVKDLKLYKGGFPAQYGGRLSSVIDVKLKEGNNKAFSGSGGLGLIASRLTLEGPIVKDRSSFIVSGRRTYVDIFTRAINRANVNKPDYNPIPDYYFYDLNTKINYQIGANDRLYISGYFGRDVFGFNGDSFNFNFDWGNATGSLRWNHVFNPKLFSNTTFTYSNYQYNITNQITGFSFKTGSNIEDINLKSDFFYAWNNRHTLRFGGVVTQHQFTVGRLKAGSDDGVVSFSAGQDFDGTEFGGYLGDEWKISKVINVNMGVRLSGFANDGTLYTGIEPRLSSRFTLSPRLSLKASYARMRQYLHLIASAGVSLPTDIWYPSTKSVKPQVSDQAALGFSYLLTKDFFLTLEGYYKKMQNQLEFVDGAQLFANDNLEEEFAVGEGKAAGFEVSIEKKEGRLKGWIGYTYANVQIGNFKTLAPDGFFSQKGFYSPIYDRKHDLSLVLFYDLGERWTLSSTFVYGSGDLRWMATGRFSIQDVGGAGFETVVPHYQERNNYRLPPYHRLDFGVMYKMSPKWGESDLTLSVVNAYDRRNAFFIYLEPEFREINDGSGNIYKIPSRIAARQVSLFPILPSITWNFKF